MGVQIVKLLGSAVDVNVNVNPAGAYDGGTTYNTGDVVEYNGSSYIAKQGTTGNLPTDTTYWQLLAEKGDTGASGDTGATGATGAAGADGTGWTGGSYDSGTGVVTFTSDDGLGFATGDLRGADGADGADGLGVPAGGTTGQILSKVSNADNDTTWSDAPSGTLDGLTDTTLTSPADGEVLSYDSGMSKWVNTTAASGGGPSTYSIIVDAAGGGDYTTIEDAITAASAGDTIFVKSGTYTPAMTFSNSTAGIQLIGENKYNTKLAISNGNFSLYGANRAIKNINIETGNDRLESYGDGSTIEDCYITSSAHYTDAYARISIGHNRGAVVNCHFNITHEGTILYSGSKEGLISNNRFTWSDGAVGDYVIHTNAINVITANTIKVTNSNADATAIYIQNSIITITGNYIEGYLRQAINAAKSAVITGNLINIIPNYASLAVIEADDYALVNSNTIEGRNNIMVVVEDHSTISNNRIVMRKYPVGNISAVFDLVGPNVTVTGNLVQPYYEGNTATAGVDAGNHEYVNITGNNFIDCTSVASNLNATNTIEANNLN